MWRVGRRRLPDHGPPGIVIPEYEQMLNEPAGNGSPQMQSMAMPQTRVPRELRAKGRWDRSAGVGPDRRGGRKGAIDPEEKPRISS